jgi:hypothetical protein
MFQFFEPGSERHLLSLDRAQSRPNFRDFVVGFEIRSADHRS